MTSRSYEDLFSLLTSLGCVTYSQTQKTFSVMKKNFFDCVGKVRKSLTMLGILLCCAMAASLFTSCSKDDTVLDGTDNDKKENIDDDIADYTVIFWGMAGSNDGSASKDLANLAYLYQQEKIGKNVQIAGLMKTSLSKLAKGEVAPSYDKTMYFDSENIGSDDIKASDFLSIETAADVQRLYKKAFDNMGGKVYGDTLYPLNNVDSLAGFIKKTAQKFPARHYVLMLFGHGSGFSLEDDAPMSRACVYDGFVGQQALSADAVVSAVEKSGVKMQSLFTQCCLMATLENIAAYSKVFDYGILSAETTYGGYFPQYLANLSAAGDDETNMQQESRKLVDYYVDVDAGQYADVYTSHGFYELKKSSALLSATKEAADWFTANYAVDSLRLAINKAIEKSIMCINLEDNYEYNQEITQCLRQARQRIQDVMYGKVSIVDMEEDDFMAYIDDIYTLTYGYQGSSGLCMADVMRNTVNSDLPQEKSNELKAVYEKYMGALKDLAYIRTSEKPVNAGADYEYIYASPTVNIFSMNSSYFIPLVASKEKRDELRNQIHQAWIEEDIEGLIHAVHKLYDGTYHANIMGLDTAKAIYSASVFDKQVGWSKFLTLLQMNPSLVYCPDRWQVNQGMK